jgi:transposase
MKRGTKTTIEHKREVLKKIVETYEEGEYPIAEICKKFNVSERTFGSWLKLSDAEISDFAGLYKKAQNNFTKDQIVAMIPRTITNLQKLADGYEYETEEVFYSYDVEENETVKCRKVTKRFIPPNLGANIFLAKNASPDLFKDAMEHNHRGSVKIPQGVDFDKCTPEQLALLESLAQVQITE